MAVQEEVGWQGVAVLEEAVDSLVGEEPLAVQEEEEEVEAAFRCPECPFSP